MQCWFYISNLPGFCLSKSFIIVFRDSTTVTSGGWHSCMTEISSLYIISADSVNSPPVTTPNLPYLPEECLWSETAKNGQQISLFVSIYTGQRQIDRTSHDVKADQRKRLEILRRPSTLQEKSGVANLPTRSPSRCRAKCSSVNNLPRKKWISIQCNMGLSEHEPTQEMILITKTKTFQWIDKIKSIQSFPVKTQRIKKLNASEMTFDLKVICLG